MIIAVHLQAIYVFIYKPMHEQAQDDTSPRQRLISLLQADFTSPDKAVLADEAEAKDNALAGLLAQVRPAERIDTRLASEENHELGEAVERLLEPAPVTISFKGFIANEVRKAHAWQSRVDDVVAPDRLGLVSGEGIFDPAHAKDIEAQTLRGYAFDIVKDYTIRPPTEESEVDLPPLLLKPTVRPSDYISAVETLVAWVNDYEHTYGEDPGEGLEPEAYLDAAPQAIVVSEEDPDWADFMGQLRRLYEDKQG